MSVSKGVTSIIITCSKELFNTCEQKSSVGRGGEKHNQRYYSVFRFDRFSHFLVFLFLFFPHIGNRWRDTFVIRVYNGSLKCAYCSTIFMRCWTLRLGKIFQRQVFVYLSDTILRVWNRIQIIKIIGHHANDYTSIVILKSRKVTGFIIQKIIIHYCWW